MTASTNDFFKKTATSTVTTLSTPGKALGATSINVGSTTNYPTDTGVIVSIRTVDTAGTLIAGTHTEWSGTVTSGTSLAIEAVPVYGSDQIYAAGSTTQVAIRLSSYSHNKLIDGLLVEHKQTGKHSDLTADSVKTDTITGTTDADSGTAFGITTTNGVIQGGAGIGVANASLSTTVGDIGGVWKAWTANVRPGSGAFSNVTSTQAYTQIGKTILYSISITLTTINTGGGELYFSLPVTAATPLGCYGNGRLDTTGAQLHVRAHSTTVASVFRYDGVVPMTDGYKIDISGFYQAA